MKIGIDFDGTIVDDKYENYLDYEWFSKFISDDCFIVTARPSYALHYIHSKCDFKIPLDKIICCGGELEKINYINKQNFDVFIDDKESILNNIKTKIKFNIKEFDWKILYEGLRSTKIFSPGPVPSEMHFKMDFSHRSDTYKLYYKNTKELLRKRLKIPSTHDILFTQGSGTSAIESVLSSILTNYTTCYIHHTGTFSERARKIAEYYCDDIIYNNLVNTTIRDIKGIFYYVQFETSKSLYTNMDKELKMCKRNKIISIVDCVSGLGFYDLPNADIIIGSSSKILRGLPAMGIVIYRKNIANNFHSATDYLSIPNYIAYGKRNETPHTPMIPQLVSLHDNMHEALSKNDIVKNCKEINSSKIELENDKICPVLTVQFKSKKELEHINKILKYFGYNMYFNPAYMETYFQISMFNYKDYRIYQILNMILEGFIE